MPAMSSLTFLDFADAQAIRLQPLAIVLGAEGLADDFLQGSDIFHSAKAECGSCHAEGGMDSKNHEFGSKARADRKDSFNTPSLSYISGRGPFFHDGRFGTLRELLVESDGMMGHTKHLNEGEMNALEAYLNTL